MYDSNESVVAGGPGVSETKYGSLHPKVDFASEPLLSMGPGSRYIRVLGTVDRCGWSATAGQLWFKCSSGLGAGCDPGAVRASKEDWERVACTMIFTGAAEPDGESLCDDSEMGDFYFIPDANGDAARLFIKWKDECLDSDWFELCPPKGNHPPAELTFDPSTGFTWDIANQKGNIPPLKVTHLMDLDGPLPLPPLTNTLNIPKAIYGDRGYLGTQGGGVTRFIPGGCVLTAIPALPVTFVDTPAQDGYPMVQGDAQLRGVVDGPGNINLTVDYSVTTGVTIGTLINRDGVRIGENLETAPACKDGELMMIQHINQTYMAKGQVLTGYTWNDDPVGLFTDTITFSMWQERA